MTRRQHQNNTQHHKRPRNKPQAPPQKRLFNMVSVQFRTNFLKVDYNAQELQLAPGEDVVVETARGPVIAQVVSYVQRKYCLPENIYKVLRRATVEDSRQAELNERHEVDAYRFALERIRSRRLPMKLIRAQYMQDESKIVFFFSADGRIDFRELVKDLAHRFRTRIEMHQIGVRDGARMLGGIGPCGRELCCSTFLEHFAPVSIRMAKDQGLTLNPKKVSGMCGRLMCCLVYEQQLYKKIKRKLPRLGTKVFTEAGPGEIGSIDIINARAMVYLEDGNRKTFEIKEITTKEPAATPVVDDISTPFVTADFLWDDVMRDYDIEHSEPIVDADTSSTNNEDKSNRRRSRRRRVHKPQKDNTSASASNNASNNNETTAESASKQSKNKSRRSKRRRNSKQGDQKQDASSSQKSNDNASVKTPQATPSSDKSDKSDKSRRRRRRRNKPQKDSKSNQSSSNTDTKNKNDKS